MGDELRSGEPVADESVQADAFFGDFGGELAVQCLGDAHVEAAGEVLIGQRGRDRLARFLHVGHGFGDNLFDPGKGLLRRGSESRQGG